MTSRIPAGSRFRLIDAHGREWSFFDKPIWTTQHMSPATPLPVPCEIPCVIVARPAGNAEIVVIEIAPEGPHSAAEQTRFEVRSDQLLIRP